MIPPPPIRGVGNAAGVTMRLELRDGSFDLANLQSMVPSGRPKPRPNRSIQRVMAPFPLHRAALHRRGGPGENRDAACLRWIRCSRR